MHRGDQKFNKECFWERGLVPAEWTQVRAPTDEHLEVDVGDISSWGGGWYFSDGSGGQHTKDPRMRRCGWSLVQLRNHSTQEYSAQGPPTRPEVRIGAWGALGGKKQTVPRAELFCVLRLLQRTREVEDKIVLWVDCSYVQEGMQKLKKMQRGANADLWQEILEERNARKELFRVRRVWKSHVAGKDIAAHCISRSHAWGNAAADEMAGEGAKLHQITPAEHTTITEVDKLAWQVLQRAVLVYTDILEKGEADIEGTTRKPERTAKTTEEKLHDIRKCGHKLYFEKGCWRCSGCRKGVRGAELTEWAESKERCQEIFVNTEAGKQTRIATEVRVGKLTAHHSHKLWSKADLLYCQHCGAWGRTKLVSLRRQGHASKDSRQQGGQR